MDPLLKDEFCTGSKKRLVAIVLLVLWLVPTVVGLAYYFTHKQKLHFLVVRSSPGHEETYAGAVAHTWC